MAKVLLKERKNGEVVFLAVPPSLVIHPPLLSTDPLGQLLAPRRLENV